MKQCKQGHAWAIPQHHKARTPVSCLLSRDSRSSARLDACSVVLQARRAWHVLYTLRRVYEHHAVLCLVMHLATW